MVKLIEKHTVKIQLAALVTIVGFVIYWTFTASAYVFKVEDNSDRLDSLEEKFLELATKDDLQVLKQDIKDFILN